MKILTVSTYDTKGGAARAAHRLHEGLLREGISASMFVQQRFDTYNDSIYCATGRIRKKFNLLRPALDRFVLELFGNGRGEFSTSWFPQNLSAEITRVNPDVVHLHWINHGFVSIEDISRIQRPLVWTLHDCWAFTGGCHFTNDCIKYTNKCGSCPQLKSSRDFDLSIINWHRKYRAWRNKKITIVTPSRWMGECARRSSLLKECRIEIIPNGIDITAYRPHDQNLGRDVFGLPANKKIILFGADNALINTRKGFHFFKAAVENLVQQGLADETVVVIFGTPRMKEDMSTGVTTYYIGTLNDSYSLNLLYSTADVFVTPSIADNLPNTIMESMASGTPCVSFNVGGISDLIDHMENGYLAEAFNVNDLSFGIKWVLQNRNSLSPKARSKVETTFDQNIVVRRHEELYASLI